MSATPPLVVHFFSPSRIQSSPSFVATVFMPPASEPAVFSERQNAMSRLPAAMSGRYFCFCSSVPPSRIGKDPSALTAKPTPMAPQAREISSTTRQRFRTGVSPAEPPYSSGIQTFRRPASAMALVTAQGYSCLASCSAATGRMWFSAISRARSRHSRFSFDRRRSDMDASDQFALRMKEASIVGSLRRGDHRIAPAHAESGGNRPSADEGDPLYPDGLTW